MSIQTEVHEQILIVRLTGYLNRPVAKELDDLLDAEISEGFRTIIFDCSQLAQISSDGMRVMLQTLRELKTLNGKMVVAALGNQVESALEITGMLKIVKAFPDTDAAISALRTATQYEGTE